jgi:chromosomal replication initiation ATPase DnaA
VRRGLGLPVLADRDAWERIRVGLRDAVGESMFEIWLAPLELIAVDTTGVLVISAPPATSSWLRSRYAGVLTRCAEREGRELRLADEPERRAVAGGDQHLEPATWPVHINQQEVS